ncbi:hypothetical protein IPH25_01525 [bacterium]|nr:MAG: hypothetical protein IPG37_03655 [bacterium]QQR62107.1 MAG: hypothetical protein IPH25_01525 [bacterium]QQR63336.1 MAG: hypothetical protein IPH67_02595 [bacterium]
MRIFDTINGVLELVHQADNTMVKKYCLGFIIAVVGLVSLLGLQYYNTISFYKKKLYTLNDLREEVQMIRQQLLYVQTQRIAVDKMLQEEVDFKIGGYFAQILEKFALTNNKKTEEMSQIDGESDYRESELITALTGMNMKQLTELLYEIEQKKRIYIKKLEIAKSKKNSDSLDILLVIATLLKKENE